MILPGSCYARGAVAAPAALVDWLGMPILATALGSTVWFTANFHHFLLDTWIWGGRAAPATGTPPAG